MIVPMKKISLITMNDKREETLRALRKLGIVQIEITEASSERLTDLRAQKSLLENAVFNVGGNKKITQSEADIEAALSVARELSLLEQEKKQCISRVISLNSELERLKGWGDIDLDNISALAEKGVRLSFYEMPEKAFKTLPEQLLTVRLATDRKNVRFMLYETNALPECDLPELHAARLKLPEESTAAIRKRASELNARIAEIDKAVADRVCYRESMQKAIKALEKQIEFEVYAAGMFSEELASEDGAEPEKAVSVAYFSGFAEAERLDILKRAAAENSWGLIVEEPCEEDNTPTKLKNNRLVSLIYPLTDFLGTVPGYFEYDISGWFLLFILIFFGIIFGDGGYGLLICAVSAVPILKSLISKQRIAPTALLIGLFGLSTVVWGTLTCTWLGLSPEQLPMWLKKLSIPVISNAYADRLWYPFWTNGTAGLTTAQNLQVFCFSLALIQLTVAHIKGAVRSRGTLKILGDIGSILQLVGIYYLVLNLVVNSAVFGFGLVICGIPVGTTAVVLIAVGFILSFVFSSFEGSIVKSVLSSLKNIVSVLLGVVNVFSDIVSYIRLWAVGLAGAAISATVNELAGPLLGDFMFMLLAVILLVFGHGLNMILNVLSVIVHGIRLNTLEFSSHLDMSWSGRKFKPFKE